MAIRRGRKLQHLLAFWPPGAVYTTSALEERGYSRSLLNQYRASGWLKLLGRGALVRRGDPVSWQGALYAAQDQLSIPVHVGGKSALLYHGSTHFLNLGEGVMTLFAPPGTRLPAWFTSHEWGVPIKLITTNLFLSREGLIAHNLGAFAITISSRERAVFEALHLAPQFQSLEEAKLLMAGLTNLRPSVVQRLLEESRSIKVKRLFLLLAEELKLQWVKKLNLERVDLGTGPRTLIKGGKTHPKYLLTVPPHLFDDGKE